MSREKQNELLISDPKSNNSEDMRNKQIEEMAKDLCEHYGTGGCDSGNCECYRWCNVYSDCEVLHKKGYRKQSEGEWIIKSEIYKLLDDVDEELYVECSICQRRFNVLYELDDEKIFKYAREHYPYCNCAAKMKGGAE